MPVATVDFRKAMEGLAAMGSVSAPSNCRRLEPRAPQVLGAGDARPRADRERGGDASQMICATSHPTLA